MAAEHVVAIMPGASNEFTTLEAPVLRISANMKDLDAQTSNLVGNGGEMRNVAGLASPMTSPGASGDAKGAAHKLKPWRPKREEPFGFLCASSPLRSTLILCALCYQCFGFRSMDQTWLLQQPQHCLLHHDDQPNKHK
jgi:hypothetical protein